MSQFRLAKFQELIDTQWLVVTVFRITDTVKGIPASWQESGILQRDRQLKF